MLIFLRLENCLGLLHKTAADSYILYIQILSSYEVHCNALLKYRDSETILAASSSSNNLIGQMCCKYLRSHLHHHFICN